MLAHSTDSADYGTNAEHVAPTQHRLVAARLPRSSKSDLAVHHHAWRNTAWAALGWHVLNWCMLAIILSLAVFYFNTIAVRPRVFSLLDIDTAQPKHPATEQYFNTLIIGITVPFGIYMLYGVGEWLLDAQSTGRLVASQLPEHLWVNWLWFYTHMMSIGITALLCQWIKDLVGELPPTFVYSCFPQGIPAELNVPPYLVNTNQCTNESASSIAERLNFPAKYATEAFSSATILTLFLWSKHVRMPLWGSDRSMQSLVYPSPYTAYRVPIEAWKVIIIWSPMVYATFYSFTRIYDNGHHLHDVLFGIFLGLLCALTTYSATYANLCPSEALHLADSTTAAATTMSSALPMHDVNGTLVELREKELN